MNRLIYSLYLLATCVLLAGGCSTNRLDSAMVHYRPKNHVNKRSKKVLLAELRDLLKYEVSEDDFLATHSVDGHTCWLILNHKESVPIVVDIIKRAKGYQFIAVGNFDSQYRAVLGFRAIQEPAANARKK